MISGQTMRTSAGADLVVDLALDIVLALDVAIEWRVFRDGQQVAQLARDEGIDVADPSGTVATLVWRSIARTEANVQPGVYTYVLRAGVDDLKVDEASGVLYVSP
jgi:hypothetical protein